MVGIIIILILGLFILRLVTRHFKRISLPCVILVSGAVKSGKSLLSVHLAIKEYKRALRSYKIKIYLKKFFHIPLKDDDYYEPMLYSNIPLADIKFNMLTIDIVLRKVRIPNKSVVLIDEASLLADSMLYQDKQINNNLMAFIKLYGHYTHGGKLIIDTQSICDLHFSFKRCLSQYLYIYERKKYPFISVLRVRELAYSADDTTMVNSFNEDIELSLRSILIFNRTYDKYDCYCYSVFTDYLPYQVVYDVKKKSFKDDLKCRNIVTFQEFAKDFFFTS